MNMSKSISNLKVFVNEEIFDFRCLEGNDVAKPKEKTDVPVLLKEKDNCTCKETLLKYSPLPSRLKRPKQKPRSRTVDPRFRRSRSPHHQQMTTTQSSDTVNKSTEVNINRFSSSSPTVNKQSCSIERLSRNPVENQKIDSPSFITERELSFVEGEDTGSKPNYEEVLNSFVTESNLVESEINYDDLNSLITEDKDPVKDLEYFKPPYWEDPRYVEKSNNIVINTVPLVSKVPNYSGSILCQVADCNKNISSYQYDQGSELCSCSLVDTGCIRKKLLHHDYEIFYGLLCSITAIIITSFIVYFILNVHLEMKGLEIEKRKYEGFFNYFDSIIGYIRRIYTPKVMNSQKKRSFMQWWHGN